MNADRTHSAPGISPPEPDSQLSLRLPGSPLAKEPRRPKSSHSQNAIPFYDAAPAGTRASVNQKPANEADYAKNIKK